MFHRLKGKIFGANGSGIKSGKKASVICSSSEKVALSPTDLGSDGNKSNGNSLTSNESAEAKPSDTKQFEADVSSPECTEDIGLVAIRTPHLIEWKPHTEVTLTKEGSASFGIKYKAKVIAQKRTDYVLLYLLVAEVEPHTPAAMYLKPGDLVLSVNQHPTLLREDNVENKEFIGKYLIKEIIQEANSKSTLRLIVRSPKGLQVNSCYHASQSKVRTVTEIHTPVSSTHPSRHTSPHQIYRYNDIDIISYLDKIDKVYPNSKLSKVPYSMIIIIGEESLSTATELFGMVTFDERNAFSNSKSTFHRGNFLIQVEGGKTCRPQRSSGTYKTWMRSPKNLKQCLDGAVSRNNGNDKQYLYVDVIALRNEQMDVNGVVASFSASGNELMLFQIDAHRLRENTKECLRELQSTHKRVLTVAGIIIPVMIVITSMTSDLDINDWGAISSIIKQFHNNNCNLRIVYSPDGYPFWVLSLLDKERVESSGSFEGSSFFVTPSRNTPTSFQDRVQPCDSDNTLPSTMLTVIMNTACEQRNLQAYPTKFLKYVELFWRMVDGCGSRSSFVKGNIKDTCGIEEEIEVSEFIKFLKITGEVFIVRPESIHEMLLLPNCILLSLQRLLTPPPLEEQPTNLRDDWLRLTSTGIASSILLEDIFGSINMLAMVITLQELGVLFHLSQSVTKSNDRLKMVAGEKNEFFYVKYVMERSPNACQCSSVNDDDKLRVKFQTQVPPDFLEKFVFRVIVNLKDKDLNWNVSPCGCFKFITEDGCAAVIQQDSSLSSVTIATSFCGDYRPYHFLSLVRRSVRDLGLAKQEQPIVGCDCPHCEVNGHTLDLNAESKQLFVYCGTQLLSHHPRVRYWNSKEQLNLVFQWKILAFLKCHILNTIPATRC